jgi:chemotaxis response regulator CheB
MPVELITDGLVLQPNHVFIIPAQRDLHILDGESVSSRFQSQGDGRT